MNRVQGMGTRDVHGVTDQEKRTVEIVMVEGLRLHMIIPLVHTKI